MKLLLTSFCFLFSIFITSGSFAQNQAAVFATMAKDDAEQFVLDFPDEITILSLSNHEAAVILSEEGRQILRNSVTTHGSKYIFHPNESSAISAVTSSKNSASQLEFTITEDAFVQTCLDAVNPDNIKTTILEYEAYGTRHHTKPQAEQAVLDQQAKWDQMITDSGRTDIRTRIYTHSETPMPSVILTIDGAVNPDEYIIIGGHMDSTSWDIDDAPGADDNASGMATLNEIFRVLLEKEFVPQRTVEIMGYAAEEIGLVGSGEIAAEYAQNGIDVLGYVQFDMTGYQGSVDDIYIAEDSYNSSALNQYLKNLMDHYNSTGDHTFTYNVTTCGYGCSDHASWAANGYHTSFPFESAFNASNPIIHTPQDVYSFFNTPNHAAKFTKLGLEYIIEAAKTSRLATPDFEENALLIWIRNKELFFDLKQTGDAITDISIINVSGQTVFSRSVPAGNNSINLEKLSSGFYFIQFKTDNNRKLLKKIALN